VSKRRRDTIALFTEARQLAAAVLRETDEVSARAERLAAGLTDLWPAPLAACLLFSPEGTGLAIRDEAGHPRPDWHEALRPQLDPPAKAPRVANALAAPPALQLPDHVLHLGAVRWDDRHYGVLALALHRRTTEAALAQVLLAHVAEHLAFRLFQEETERRELIHYRDLADLTNLVGHEFNNALNAIGLQIAALGQKGLTAEHHPELAEVRRQVAAAGALVRRLQDLCYKANSPRQPADLNRAVRTALAQRARLALAPDLPPVQGTALDLERLADALARGSTATPGSAAVTVRTGRGSGTTVWLRVEDATADFDDALLPRLFEPFVGLRPEDDGTALALARAVARRLGGSVRAERRPGGGVVFVAELRAAD